MLDHSLHIPWFQGKKRSVTWCRCWSIPISQSKPGTVSRKIQVVVAHRQAIAIYGAHGLDLMTQVLPTRACLAPAPKHMVQALSVGRGPKDEGVWAGRENGLVILTKVEPNRRIISRRGDGPDRAAPRVKVQGDGGRLRRGFSETMVYLPCLPSVSCSIRLGGVSLAACSQSFRRRHHSRRRRAHGVQTHHDRDHLATGGTLKATSCCMEVLAGRPHSLGGASTSRGNPDRRTAVAEGQGNRQGESRPHHTREAGQPRLRPLPMPPHEPRREGFTPRGPPAVAFSPQLDCLGLPPGAFLLSNQGRCLIAPRASRPGWTKPAFPPHPHPPPTPPQPPFCYPNRDDVSPTEFFPGVTRHRAREVGRLMHWDMDAVGDASAGRAVRFPGACRGRGYARAHPASHHLPRISCPIPVSPSSFASVGGGVFSGAWGPQKRYRLEDGAPVERTDGAAQETVYSAQPGPPPREPRHSCALLRNPEGSSNPFFALDTGLQRWETSLDRSLRVRAWSTRYDPNPRAASPGTCSLVLRKSFARYSGP